MNRPVACGGSPATVCGTAGSDISGFTFKCYQVRTRPVAGRRLHAPNRGARKSGFVCQTLASSSERTGFLPHSPNLAEWLLFRRVFERQIGVLAMLELRQHGTRDAATRLGLNQRALPEPFWLETQLFSPVTSPAHLAGRAALCLGEIR